MYLLLLSSFFASTTWWFSQHVTILKKIGPTWNSASISSSVSTKVLLFPQVLRWSWTSLSITRRARSASVKIKGLLPKQIEAVESQIPTSWNSRRALAGQSSWMTFIVNGNKFLVWPCSGQVISFSKQGGGHRHDDLHFILPYTNMCEAQIVRYRMEVSSIHIYSCWDLFLFYSARALLYPIFQDRLSICFSLLFLSSCPYYIGTGGMIFLCTLCDCTTPFG